MANKKVFTSESLTTFVDEIKAYTDNAVSGKANSSHVHDVATTSANGFMSSAMVTKLNGIATGANKITVDSSLSTTSTNPVQNKVVNTALINITDEAKTYTDSAVFTKVDKVTGKGLSTNDYTNEEKDKLASAILKTGGTITGSLTVEDNLVLGNESTGPYLSGTYSLDGTPILGIYGSEGDELTRVEGILDPTGLYDAANKSYVDSVASTKADATHTHSEYMTATNPTGTGSFSMNRLAGSEIGDYSHAEGYNTQATGKASHAEGLDATAMTPGSHAEGQGTVAQGSGSHAEGTGSVAGGDSSHAEGYTTNAAGVYSHAEGSATVASGNSSHAEGCETKALGDFSHAEGTNTTANAPQSHAEGANTTASGSASHAEGANTTVSGNASHAEGYFTSATGENQHVQGHYNVDTYSGCTSGTNGAAAFIIGNGTQTAPSNAFRVTYAGKPYAKNSLQSSGADYAEFFEWLDGNQNNEDRRGYFVTLDGDKIKIAEPDDYILGIISGMPSIIGNADESWLGRYVFDEFGAFVYEDFEYIDEITGETKTGQKYKENPGYDPTIVYSQREDRPEWDAVGMIGVLSVRDDGTCQVNGYCKVDNGGTATASTTGYRVIKRVNENIVKVVFR